MTTVIILAAILIPCAFAFGWAVGHYVGKTDGYAEAADDWRRMYDYDCSPFAWEQMPYDEGGAK